MNNIPQAAIVNNPLQGLHDIHLPAHPHWWPLAPGWWVIIGLLVLTISLVVIFKWRKNHWQKKILNEVIQLIEKQDCDLACQLAGLSSILRRVALRRFPDQAIANLYGEQWIKFLKTNSSDKQIALNILQPLANEIYQKKSAEQHLKIDDPLVQFANKWIRENLR